MTNEIKEIIDYLKIENGTIGSELSYEETHLLLDYITNLQTIEQQYSAILSENAELENKITNLQEENEKLKDENGVLKLKLEECKSGCKRFYEDKIEIQQRIDKAIEYINVELFNSNIDWVRNNDGCVTGSDLPGDAIFPIIDILQGEDK